MNAICSSMARGRAPAPAGAWLAMLVVAALAWAAPARAADTEPSELPDGIVAKMARMSAKLGVDRDGSDRERDEERRARGRAGGADKCSVNLGNVDTGGRIGHAPRQVTVLIKGDVFNANNRCR